MRGLEQRPGLYDAWMTVLERGGFGRWRREVVREVRGTVLEVGTGTGRNLPLYPDDARVVATDPDLLVLRKARTRAPGAPLVVARAEALPFPTGSFDGVMSSLVFCSVDDPASGLSEIRRVLRPEGTLHMLEHVRSENRFVAWLQDRIQPLWTWIAGGCRPNRRTERSVLEAGFTIEPDSFRGKGVMRRFRARIGAPADVRTGSPDGDPELPVEAAAFRHLHEAELARGYLDDAGIPAAAVGDPAGEIQYGKRFSPGARLLVRAEDLEPARQVLRGAGVIPG
jgi:ubiquinone/menaquinone biosynthesis C-methylase UbiE